MYESLSNENRILYRQLATQNEKIEKIKNLLKEINFADVEYLELYRKFIIICKLLKL